MGDILPLSRHLAQGIDIEAARKEGYIALEPICKQVAIEFVTTGHTLKQIAYDMGQPLGEIRRAFAHPLTRAFIADLQNEMAQHKIINASWVESQILAVWPQLRGEEDVEKINMKGEQVRGRHFHGPEVVAVLKHFSGNADQKAAGGVNVVINFGDMGVTKTPNVTIEGEKA